MSTQTPSSAQPSTNMSENKPSFDTCFWGPDDRGLAALMARLKSSKRTCEQLLVVFRERASMEEDYSKRLSRLSKSFKSDDEEPDVTFTSALLKVKEEMESSAQDHAALGEAIRRELETPLAEFIDYQRSHRDVCEKILKSKIAQESALIRAKEKYESKSIELLQLQGNARPALNSRDAEKTQAKLEKLTIQVSSTEQEYRVSSHTLQETFAIWEKAFKKACVDCERMEVDRYAFLREKIWHWMNLQSSLCVKEDEGFEAVRQGLEACNFEQDLQVFMSRRGTGSEIKRPPVYEPFSVDSKAALDAMTSPTYSGSSLNMNSLFSALGISRKASVSTLSTDPGKSSGPATSPRPLSTLQNEPLSVNPPNSMAASTPNLPNHYSLRRDYPQYVYDPSINQKPPPSVPATGGNEQPPASSEPPLTDTSKFAYYPDPTDQREQQKIEQQSQSIQEVQHELAQSNLPVLASQHQQHEPGSDILPPPGMMFYDPYDFSQASNILFSVRVLFDYTAQAPEELSLAQGQVLAVFRTLDDGWWEAIAAENGRKRVGLFPSNFTQVMP